MTRTPIARGVVGAAWLAAILVLVALGTWQIQRRAWKLDLIAHVEAGLRAAPVPAPVPAPGTAGPGDVGLGDAYRRVTATGRFLPAKDSFVQASTVRGPGWWVLTPLRTDAGRIVLVNRGYVPKRGAPPAGAERVTVTGLLRLSEPGGGFLRRNDPAADRWFSRDVAAIAARRGIATVPYFIDRDASANAPGRPVGGLTVVTFPNNHLIYAITWYTLAMMTAAGFYYWIMLARRGRGA